MSDRSSSSITVLGVAVAAIVTVATSEGQFTLWNLIVGLILISVLSCYEISEKMQTSETLTLSATWSFIIMIALGVVLQWFYDLLSSQYSTVFPSRKPDHEGPGEYYFFFWLVIAIVAYVVIKRKQRNLRNIESKPKKD